MGFLNDLLLFLFVDEHVKTPSKISLQWLFIRNRDFHGAKAPLIENTEPIL